MRSSFSLVIRRMRSEVPQQVRVNRFPYPRALGGHLQHDLNRGALTAVLFHGLASRW